MLEFIISALIGVSSITCIDGDTIKCKDGTGKAYTVRLAKIDAPEKAQPFGKESRETLESLLRGRRVILQTFAKDKYGRTLGILHGEITTTFYEDFNAIMVRRGYAWNYGSKGYSYQEWLARRDRAGLWVQENPESPSDYRKRQHASKL